MYIHVMLSNMHIMFSTPDCLAPAGQNFISIDKRISLTMQTIHVYIYVVFSISIHFLQK